MVDASSDAAVVGASGFLGRALVNALHSSGIATARFTRKRPALSAGGRPAIGLTTARTIFWMATSINPWIAENDPDRVEQDLDALRTTLDALDAQEVSTGTTVRPRVVLMSSGGTVYDVNARPPYVETAPLGPASAYGRAKVVLETLLRQRRADAVVVRVANAYGPGQPLAPGQGVLGHWLRAVRGGRPIHVFGSPTAARDYVYVDDVVAALVAVHRAPEPPAVVNVGSGRPTPLSELIALIRRQCGDIEVNFEAARGFDVERTWLDVSLAARALGWRPATDLASGIAATWAWLRADPRR